jgi:hypothetical protein
MRNPGLLASGFPLFFSANVFVAAGFSLRSFRSKPTADIV